MAHFAGLVAAGLYPNPCDHAHVVTTTTHKTLRGPRGGMILTHDKKLYKAINKNIFPGIQGGPLMHVIASKAVSFKEALKPEFKEYQKNVKENAAFLAEEIERLGLRIVSGGTDSHVFLVDLTPKDVTGKAVEKALEDVNVTVNKNTIPDEKLSPFVTSGIRIGTPAVTTRGMKKADMTTIAEIIVNAIDKMDDEGQIAEQDAEDIKKRVEKLCTQYPLYKNKL